MRAAPMPIMASPDGFRLAPSSAALAIVCVRSDVWPTALLARASGLMAAASALRWSVRWARCDSALRFSWSALGTCHLLYGINVGLDLVDRAVGRQPLGRQARLADQQEDEGHDKEPRRHDQRRPVRRHAKCHNTKDGGDGQGIDTGKAQKRCDHEKHHAATGAGCVFRQLLLGKLDFSAHQGARLVDRIADKPAPIGTLVGWLCHWYRSASERWPAQGSSDMLCDRPLDPLPDFRNRAAAKPAIAAPPRNSSGLRRAKRATSSTIASTGLSRS